MNEELKILYSDNHLLAVDKPAGLLTQGDRSGDRCLLDLARSHIKRTCGKPGNVYVGLVHRLDRNASGVVLLARTSKAAGRLSRQFREKTVVKIYRAVACGMPPAESGELRAWLATAGDRRGVTRTAQAAFPDAREAVLKYRVLAGNGDHSHLEVQPVTGRRHQIRAQLGLVGCPLLGDVKYGAAGSLPDRRIALHARRLEVAHPIGGDPLVLEAPLPADWPWPPPAAERSGPHA